MTSLLKKFLEKIQVIKALKPTYRQPGDGSDGTCDCIGLIIGAIRRCGLTWKGIHGSNYTARRAAVKFRHISTASELELGDVVLKGKQPGEPGYALPARYKPGGAYYNGDLTDYYHAGVVTSLNPLNITHMSAGMTVDKKLGKWNYALRAKPLVDAGAYNDDAVQIDDSTILIPDIPTTGAQAIVTAPSGRYVKMRQQPSTNCRLWEEVPVGATVVVEKPGEDWAQISYGKRKNWYMMAKFLQMKGT